MATAAIENVADAVTHARFVGTDPNSDEVVLMKILHVSTGVLMLYKLLHYSHTCRFSELFSLFLLSVFML